MREIINWAYGLACRAGLHGQRRTLRGHRRSCTRCAATRQEAGRA